MWNWQWLEDSDSEQDGMVNDEPEDATPSGNEESCSEDLEEEEDTIPAITHTVVFKCIGCTKELHY